MAAITIETAQLVLRGLLKSSNKKITIEEIQKRLLNILILGSLIHSPRRSRSMRDQDKLQCILNQLHLDHCLRLEENLEVEIIRLLACSKKNRGAQAI